MPDFIFNPSSAYIVKPDTPISECVRTMRDHGFGAVLVSDPGTGLPSGIFTERDLLKWVEQIEAGTHWNKPVFLLMSKPIQTISIDEMDRAGSIMVEKNIRHLPVVHTDEETGATITSMISMRDVLKNLVRDVERLTREEKKTLHVGMIAKSKGMRTLIRKISAQHGNALVEAIDLRNSLHAQSATLDRLDVLIFDLDHFDSETWVSALRTLNAMPEHPEVILIYDPVLHSEVELEALTKLGLSGRFSAYMKPLDLFILVNRLHLVEPQ